MLHSRLNLLSLVLLAVILAGVLWAVRWLSAPPPPTPQSQSAQADEQAQIEQAIRAAIEAQRDTTPALLLFDTHIDNIIISAEGSWATAWLTPIDPDTAEPMPTEPGLALAQKVNGRWQAYLPPQPDWIEAMRSAPADLVPAEHKAEALAAPDMRPLAAPAAPLSGYRLPWANSQVMRLTQSIAHDRYTASGNAHFSFDFATAYPSKMFNVHAAKGGRVVRARWTQSNGSTASPGNYLVLEDTTSSPTTYQLYLHLAQDSIPENLRITGAYVQRGQFLGIADDTGESSGHHLHYMVHTNPSSYWGTSVDIVFEDVAINGGRPRIRADEPYCKSSDVCNSFQIDYVSQNYYANDALAPTGGIRQPANGAVVAGSVVTLEGWAQDEGGGGLASVQFIARLNGSWQPIGPVFNTSSYRLNWDMCAAKVPEGPQSVALRIQDGAGNNTPGLPGLTHFNKSEACPVPPAALTCVPGSSQVAIFADKNFHGDCVVLGAGSYPNPSSLGPLLEDRASSIQVGANVRATLFSEASTVGRSETFTGSDSNLADNRIGKDSLSSLIVQTRSTAPAVPLLVWPAEAASFSAGESLSLSWQDRGGAEAFQARLLLNGSQLLVTEWQAQHSWRPRGLIPGSYTWQVRARSSSGAESAWSSQRSLQLQPAPALSPAVAAPFSDNLENGAPGWTSSGGWDLISNANHSPGGGRSWQYAPGDATYNTNSANAGSLTTPPVQLPAEGAAYLRFWYQYETESSETQWDQRWVQISVDGGAFTDLAQLSNDPANHWLQSPAFSLADYAGKIVRVRFYFTTLDAIFNGYKGWYIDDVSITTEAPPACSDSDDRPTFAISIPYNSAKNAAICPNGDIDYFVFQGTAGDSIGAWIESAVNGAPLDAELSLLDSDGRSLLEKSDDQIQYLRPDPWIASRLPRTGTYYLRVTAWDHPSAGSPAHTYTLHLYKDTQKPAAVFVQPGADRMTGSDPIQFRVDALDGQSGISFVKFFWHSSDWQGSNWIEAGEDWDGRDGWGVTYKLPIGASASGSAVYARVYDWAGNYTSLGMWNLRGPGIFLPIIFKGR